MDEILNRNQLEYRGTLHPKPGITDQYGQTLLGYLPDSALVEAVNLAIYLKRPLLIKGEPGCGKTRLARAVAYELDLPYIAWNVKSTSKACDGLYTYDTVGRLRDAQLAATKRQRNGHGPFGDDPTAYIRWGPLGRAFQSNTSTVVLNDLLLELDERRFVVEETGQEVHAKERTEPIVFITTGFQPF